ADLLCEALAWRDALLAGRAATRETEAARQTAAIGPGDRIAYLVPPGRDHVAVQLGIWLAGGIAVPLAISHPMRELEYILDDARPSALVADPHHPATHLLAASPSAQSATILTLDAPRPTRPATPPALHAPSPHHPALLIYTSGTTGRPKGVLTTHANLTAQITALTTAWAWTEHDRILHTLPLHHIHGVVNALACALWSGAAVEFGSGAPASTWDRLASGEITLFMSVPTVYTRLIRAWEEAAPAVRERWSRGAAGLRLMVSGSAALPAATLERWREITGHTLLERYGMTEIGMALSNPHHGERRPGHVGLPLPGVELRLVDGEIEVRGPQVFQEYWRRPAETAAAFRGGWFRTGDEARVGEGGYYRILGRRDIDIVKTGGYKVSALEVEELYRTHPAVHDLAVVGVPHPEWGEQLRAAWVPAAAGEGTDDAPGLDGAALRAWGKERLAPYKVPHEFMAVPSLPRNAMGKVQKAAIHRMLLEPGDPH
ncbi:MAG: acyl-CoA synthetase, partial [Gemmatimonadetes bacterium]|nr:acyl-CoA synthetase [Gemmatimonadota bacterium]